jgi:hypothetical protein
MNIYPKIIFVLFFLHLTFAVSAVDHFDYPHKTHLLEGVEAQQILDGDSLEDEDESSSDSQSSSSSSDSSSDTEDEDGSGSGSEQGNDSDSESSDDEEEFVEEAVISVEKLITRKEVDERNNLNYVRFCNQFDEYSQKKEKFEAEHPGQIFSENVPNYPGIKHLHLHIKGIVSFHKAQFLEKLYPQVEALTLVWDGIVRPNVVVDNLVQYLSAFPKAIKLKLTYRDRSNRLVGPLCNRVSVFEELLQRIQVLVFDSFPLCDNCFEGLMRGSEPFPYLKSLSFKDVPFSDDALRILAGSLALGQLPAMTELFFDEIPLTERLSQNFIKNIALIRPDLNIIGISALQEQVEQSE